MTTGLPVRVAWGAPAMVGVRNGSEGDLDWRRPRAKKAQALEQVQAMV
jgi:hypothetical protein